MRSPSPSTWKIVASKASHRRAALVNTAANTGWTSLGELEMTRRISAVAVCCSSASLRALVSSAYDGAGGPLGLAVRGVPHSPQNFTCGRSRAGTGDIAYRASPESGSSAACQAQRHGTRAAAGARRPGRSVGTGAPTLPRPGLGRQMGGSGRGSPWSLWGDPVGGSDGSELTSTPRS